MAKSVVANVKSVAGIQAAVEISSDDDLYEGRK